MFFEFSYIQFKTIIYLQRSASIESRKDFPKIGVRARARKALGATSLQRLLHRWLQRLLHRWLQSWLHRRSFLRSGIAVGFHCVPIPRAAFCCAAVAGDLSVREQSRYLRRILFDRASHCAGVIIAPAGCLCKACRNNQQPSNQQQANG